MKKKLITAVDVKNSVHAGDKVLYVEVGTIITPAAKDTAAELGVAIKTGPAPQQAEPPQAAPACCTSESIPVANGIDPALIAKIVSEVVSSMTGVKVQELVKEADPSGVRLIRGDSVTCESFNTGNPKHKVGIKEILTNRESPNMATGFMTVEESTFSWDLKYEELDYIIEGTLDIIVDGKTYRGKPGDVFYLPKDTTITFSSPDKAKFFFVTFPANWAELSDYDKK